MPIKVEEAKKYKGYKEDEVKIVRFLEKSKGNAFTDEEMRNGIGRSDIVYSADEKGSYWTWQNAGLFALNVTDRVLFNMTLEKMVKERKISVSEVAGKKYYFVE